MKNSQKVQNSQTLVPKSHSFVMAGKPETLSDHLRCNRTDGRQWRCNRRVVDGKKLCEVHYLQGRHRSNKQKVPEELKIQRKLKNPDGKNEVRVGKSGKKRKKKGGVELGKRKRVIGESEALDKALKRMKLKKGDMELELIRMVLKREVEKRRKRRELECESDSDGDSKLVTKDLPNGFMAISTAPSPLQISNAAGGGSSFDVKVGVDVGTGSSRRVFRSKNIEPLPVGALQVVPFGCNVKKGKRKRCHWCRKSGRQNLVKCLSCAKEFFCLECIKQRYFDTQEEVKMACPVCRRSCRCNVCLENQSEEIERKEQRRDDRDVEKIVCLHYLICILLPILKEINEEQNNELEKEAKIKGIKPTELDIEWTETELIKQQCCSKCKLPIVDLHRGCPNCSLRLCLGCCLDFGEAKFPESLKVLVSKFLDRNKPESEQIFKQQLTKTLEQGVLNSDLTSVTSLKWKTCKVGIGMLCPANECGGCGDSLLNMRHIFPLGWTRKLQDCAEEIVCSYAIPETSDISSGCSYCLPLDHEDNRSKQQEAAMREDSVDNFLYYPTIMDIQNDKIDHFQKHWCRGQPVIVRNVLQSTSELTWDPVVMFSAYLESSIIKCKNGDGHSNSTNCPDWFEVDISTRQVFMGSLKGQMQPKMSQMLKLKAWLSSSLLQEHFSAHYAEIFQSLPLKQYMNPKSGILNLAAKVPQNITMPDLGPCVYITYGNRENIVQGEFVTKLSYGPYDVVNILAHASDVPISDEWLTKIEKLMRKRSHAENCRDSTISEDKSMEEDITKGKSEPLNDKLQGEGLPNIIRDANLHKRVAGAFGFPSGSYEGRSLVFEDKNISHDRKHYGHDISDVACGAQWDVFRRQDVPKLLEYLRRHSDEFFKTYNSQEQVINPIFDQSLFLDNTHKTRLKEEFQIEPWTFVQRIGEAVIIPAGCPYQIRSLKSCVNVVLDFVSPESVKESIQLNKEICMLPEDHKAKVDQLELKNIALNSISEAVREIRELTNGKYNTEAHPGAD